jgi:hypothetical protein
MIKYLIKKISNILNSDEKKLNGFTSPDKDGVIHGRFDDGSISDNLCLNQKPRSRFDKNLARKMDLVSQGFKSIEADGIIKSEERNEKIDNLLK